MLNTLNINLKTDIKNDRATALGIKLMSQDKNNNQFILRFTNGGEPVTLDDTYTVEILTKFSNSGASRLTSAIVRQDYATWEFDTEYITQDEMVYNYVYVRKAGSLVVSADANAFYFDVGLSEIDKDAGRVAEVYDENYEKVLADYSGALDDRTTERLDEAVLDFNQRGDAEIADWREGADSELADKVQNFKLKNEVVNGDFSEGTYGWLVLSGYNNRFEVVDGVARSTETDLGNLTNTRSFITNTLSIPLGHIVYSNIKLKINDPTKVSSVSILYGLSASNGQIPISLQGADFNNYSGLLDWKTGDRLRIFANFNTPENIPEMYLDYATLLDLTEIFGTGNEPSKAEMDELIKITGYFDEITLTQKQMLTWQLKLMRQNRNALVALGGTII